MKKLRVFIFIEILILATLSVSAQDISRILQKVKPAVFTVYAVDENGKVFSQGSGFFVEPSGIAITNFHVLEGADNAYIKDCNGLEFKVQSVVDYNPDYDLVKFRIKKSNKNTNFPSIKLSYVAAKQGEQILSYSSPLGLENTVSTGIVSAIRKMKGYGSVIQVTAPISHGSSGSPIVNYFGDVLGVSTFGFSEGQSLNFAVGCEQIKKLTRQLNISVSQITRDSLFTKNIRKAYALGEQNLYNEAILCLNNEISMNPNNHMAYYYRGLYRCRKEPYRFSNTGLKDLAYANSLSNYKNYNYILKFVTFYGNSIIESMNKSQPYSQDDVDLLLSLTSKALDLDPYRGDICIEIVRVLINCIQYDKSHKRNYMFSQDSKVIAAQDILKECITLAPSAYVHVISARFHEIIEQYRNAILDCDAAIELNKYCFPAYCTRAMIKAEQYDLFNEGLYDVDKAIALAESGSCNPTKSELADVYCTRAVINCDKFHSCNSKQQKKELYLKAREDLYKAYNLSKLPHIKDKIQQLEILKSIFVE